MDFELDENTLTLVELARDFSKKELLPSYMARSSSDRVDPSVWKQLAELGFVGMRATEEYGGAAVGDVTAGLVLKEIAYGDFNFAYALTTQHLMTEMIQNFASDDIKTRWLPRQVAGDSFIAFALTEPDAGSDVKAMHATARREEGEVVIRGEKTSVSVVEQADAFVVFARSDQGGFDSVFVEADTEGITRGRFNDMGCLPNNRGWVSFDDVRVPVDNIISEKSLKTPLLGVDYARIHVCMMCIGAARASLDEATQYAKERTAFGSPIARFEDVSFKLVRARTMLDAAELQCLKALWLKDTGGEYVTDASKVKSWIPRLCANIIHDLILVFGHYGYTDEFNVQQRLRDVIGFEIADGTDAIQNLHLVKEWLGREYLPY